MAEGVASEQPPARRALDEAFLNHKRLDDVLDGVARLGQRGGGHQYYANTREFVLAASVCEDDGLALLIGERANPARPGIELMMLRYRCP